MKPYSESCEQNRVPILEVLKVEIGGCRRLLEIGSGTGQHAVYFAPEFPGLVWQTSDVNVYHDGIQAWLNDCEADNLRAPLSLDVCRDPWPEEQFDVVFSANTTHIMSWPEVECMLAGVGRILQPEGRFCLYGPFNYNGQFTSESNARFEQWLKARDPLSGIRDFEQLDRLADQAGLELHQDHAMPANNRLLVWIKKA